MLNLLAEKVNTMQVQLSDGGSSFPTHQPNIVLPPIKLDHFDGTDITK
jgi:hypothetical protein